MRDAIVFFSVIFAGLLLWFLFKRAPAPRFRRRSALTGSDVEFFSRLRQALHDCIVAPNVAVSALIEPVGGLAVRRDGGRRVQGQRVGYAVFDEDLNLLAVIDLRHRERRSRGEAERDKFFASAGVKTLRFHAKRLPTPERIRSEVFKAATAANRTGNLDDPSVPVDFVRAATPWRNTMNAHG